MSVHGFFPDHEEVVSIHYVAHESAAFITLLFFLGQPLCPVRFAFIPVFRQEFLQLFIFLLLLFF